jgi:hypothetical protein
LRRQVSGIVMHMVAMPTVRIVTTPPSHGVSRPESAAPTGSPPAKPSINRPHDSAHHFGWGVGLSQGSVRSNGNAGVYSPGEHHSDGDLGVRCPAQQELTHAESNADEQGDVATMTHGDPVGDGR